MAINLSPRERDTISEYVARGGHVLRNNSVVFGLLIECFSPCIDRSQMGSELTKQQATCLRNCAKKHIYAGQHLSLWKLETSRGLWKQELPKYSTEYFVEEDQPTAEYFDAFGQHIEYIEDEELLQPDSDDIPPTEIVENPDGTKSIRVVRMPLGAGDGDEDDGNEESFSKKIEKIDAPIPFSDPEKKYKHYPSSLYSTPQQQQQQQQQQLSSHRQQSSIPSSSTNPSLSNLDIFNSSTESTIKAQEEFHSIPQPHANFLTRLTMLANNYFRDKK